jgi:hypothetical protein
MHASMWSYIWDLCDMGIENVVKELKESGFTGISVNTAYHAGRFLQVRSNKRKTYFPQDGALYYPVNKNLYKDMLIQPEQARIMDENPYFWDELFNICAKYSMDVSGWTVCLHNTRIGMKYPQVAVRNVYNDPCYYNLCPSNDNVRMYIKTVIAELTKRYPFHALELESLNYMGFSHEFHHEKDGYGLTQKAQFLLSLCFCDACMEKAKKAGVPIEEAKRNVKKYIDDILKAGIPEDDDNEFLNAGIEYFKNDPAVYTYLKWRSSVVTLLASEIREVADQKTKIYFLSLLTPSLSWLFGVDFAQIGKVSDGIVVCCYDTDAKQVGLDMQQSYDAVNNSTRLFTGLRLFYPEVHDEQELTVKMKNAIDSGSEGFLLYNYGLVPQTRLEWAKNSIRSITE